MIKRILPVPYGAGIVLDLGSGTGRFSSLLANHFARRVYAVEPSARMQHVAAQLDDHSGVIRIRGRAEAIPLVADLVDAAFLSQMLHHVSDLDACARELGRVVRPSGIVLIRSTFRGRLSGIRMYDFFPRALELDNQRLHPLDHVIDAFSRRSFEATSVETVHYRVDASLRDHLKRVRLRAASVLDLLSDEEFTTGLRAMEAAAAVEPHTPVLTRVDVIVLRRGT